jgi:SAM-dependent methyltransferase
MQPARVRDVFAVDESVVAALPGTRLTDGNSQQRYRAWRTQVEADGDGAVEYLVPRIEVEVPGDAPDFMSRVAACADDELRRSVEELGPWEVPYRLAGDLSAMPDDMVSAVAAARFWYRIEIVNGAVARLLGKDLERATALDVGCHSGLFTLDLAARGAARVDGIDLRAHNIAQARFVAAHYGVENVSFAVNDVDDLRVGEWDVVLNLGVLYHVLNPFELIRRTHALCRSIAVIDTVCHTEPVSAFIVMGDKDTNRTSEGKAEFELHPTYRAVIDLMVDAGFSEIFEVVGRGDYIHDLYETGNRRCFLAVK